MKTPMQPEPRDYEIRICPGSSRRGDLVKPVLRGVEGAGRQNELFLVWSQRPRRRHLSENQQPQTKVRRRLMRMLEYLK